MLRPRNRLVYFRVSEDEYQRFNELCVSTGSRSISDLARSAMQSMMQESSDKGETDRVSQKLAALETLMNELHHKVHQIATSVQAEVPGSHNFNGQAEKPAHAENERLTVQQDE